MIHQSTGQEMQKMTEENNNEMVNKNFENLYVTKKEFDFNSPRTAKSNSAT